MSGGYFDYQQYRIQNIADSVENLIENNFRESESEYQYEFSEETKKEFKKGLKILKMAAIYATRMDWLLSDDDGEDSFHKRLKKELKHINED